MGYYDTPYCVIKLFCLSITCTKNHTFWYENHQWTKTEKCLNIWCRVYPYRNRSLINLIYLFWNFVPKPCRNRNLKCIHFPFFCSLLAVGIAMWHNKVKKAIMSHYSRFWYDYTVEVSMTWLITCQNVNFSWFLKKYFWIIEPSCWWPWISMDIWASILQKISSDISTI